MRTVSTHRLTRSGAALATALCLAAGPARAFEPAATDPTETADLAQAKQRYEQADYLPAAKLFEQLHERTGKPLYLYYAGLARENLGHDAHAIVHWQRALANGLAPDLAARATTRLEQARSRTTALTVTVTPAAVLDGAVLELRQPGARKPLTFPLADLRRPDGTLAPIHLEAGKWTATVTPKHPGFTRSAASIELALNTASQSLALTLPPLEHPTTFEVAPPAAVRAGVTLSLHDPDDLTPDRREQLTRATITIPLRAGDWQYTLAAPGYTPRSGTLTVVPGAKTHTFTLAPEGRATNSDALPTKTRRRLALGLGLASLAPLAAGATLTALGLANEPDATAANNLQLPKLSLIAVDPYFTWGPLLLAGTGGLWAGTLVAGTVKPRRSIPTLLSLGAAFGVAGLAWNLGTFPARDEPFKIRSEEVLPTSDWRDHKTQAIPSAVLIGLGTGLLVSGITTLVVSRVAAGRSRNPSRARVAPLGLGLQF